MKIELIDKDGLGKKLRSLSRLQFETVAIKSLTELFNRAYSMTPFRTGELVKSRSVRMPNGSFDGEFGYTKEYAPHVEYGHRTRGGGYVQGQRFLKRNVDTQRPIFERDISDFLACK